MEKDASNQSNIFLMARPKVKRLATPTNPQKMCLMPSEEASFEAWTSYFCLFLLCFSLFMEQNWTTRSLMYSMFSTLLRDLKVYINACLETKKQIILTLNAFFPTFTVSTWYLCLRNSPKLMSPKQTQKILRCLLLQASNTARMSLQLLFRVCSRAYKALNIFQGASQIFCTSTLSLTSTRSSSPQFSMTGQACWPGQTCLNASGSSCSLRDLDLALQKDYICCSRCERGTYLQTWKREDAIIFYCLMRSLRWRRSSQTLRRCSEKKSVRLQLKNFSRKPTSNLEKASSPLCWLLPVLTSAMGCRRPALMRLLRFMRVGNQNQKVKY